MNIFLRYITLLLIFHAFSYVQAQAAAVLYITSERSENVVTENNTVPLLVPFELDWNLIWVEGMVDDKRGFFILDTGAPTLILNNRGHKPSGYKSATTEGYGLGGDVSMQPHRVKSFQLGGVEQGAQAAYQIDLREVEARAGREINGLVGYEQFNDYELLIDYPARRVVLYPKGKNDLHATENPLQSLKFMRYSHLPLLRLQQGKKRLVFVLDTGAGVSLIHKETAEKLRLAPELSTEETFLVGVDGNRQAAPIVHIPQLQLGSEDLSGFPLGVTDLSHLSEEEEGFAIDGVLGTDFLKTHRISIDYKKHRLHFWPIKTAEIAR